MSEGETKDIEIMASLDTLPSLIRMGMTKTAEDFLRRQFEESLSIKIARYGELPDLFIRLRSFDSLIREARALYVDEYYRAAVALCGMTVEALCIAIAEERVKEEYLKKQMINPSVDCRKKIKPLKKYLRIAKSASLLHQVLDVRKEYLHLHKTRVLSEDALKCINTLHVALIAEYGLVPADRGKVRFATEEDVEQIARKIGLPL